MEFTKEYVLLDDVEEATTSNAMRVSGAAALNFQVEIGANPEGATGGVTIAIEGTVDSTTDEDTVWTVIDSTAKAAGDTAAYNVSVTLVPFNNVRTKTSSQGAAAKASVSLMMAGM